MDGPHGPCGPISERSGVSLRELGQGGPLKENEPLRVPEPPRVPPLTSRHAGAHGEDLQARGHEPPGARCGWRRRTKTLRGSPSPRSRAAGTDTCPHLAPPSVSTQRFLPAFHASRTPFNVTLLRHRASDGPDGSRTPRSRKPAVTRSHAERGRVWTRPSARCLVPAGGRLLWLGGRALLQSWAPSLECPSLF